MATGDETMVSCALCDCMVPAWTAERIDGLARGELVCAWCADDEHAVREVEWERAHEHDEWRGL